MRARMRAVRGVAVAAVEARTLEKWWWKAATQKAAPGDGGGELKC